jgi:hypothetical protein
MAIASEWTKLFYNQYYIPLELNEIYLNLNEIDV